MFSGYGVVEFYFIRKILKKFGIDENCKVFPKYYTSFNVLRYIRERNFFHYLKITDPNYFVNISLPVFEVGPG